jgi:hypothetical protein
MSGSPKVVTDQAAHDGRDGLQNLINAWEDAYRAAGG